LASSRQSDSDTSTSWRFAAARIRFHAWSLGVADAFDLVEPGDRVAHVPRVGQRLLALFLEGELLFARSSFSAVLRPSP